MRPSNPSTPRAVLAAFVLFALSAGAGGARALPDGLGGELPGDALAAGRLARVAGDAALRASLQAESPSRRDVLAALRAAAQARAPEALVPDVCRWAKSRDPHLAPAAARALYDIAGSLDPRDLSSREVPLATLRKAREALDGVIQHEPVPAADVLFAARYLDAALVQVLSSLGAS